MYIERRSVSFQEHHYLPIVPMRQHALAPCRKCGCLDAYPEELSGTIEERHGVLGIKVRVLLLQPVQWGQ
ncbi:hypothetical protein KDH_48430 [Dictyobacter sp. S3.2.2.5]|uniref:Transposase IS66 zinc-finger binding domain-containing protein n=1 Tax=Dictyobacter halimunensis TaxID=3026934 RepID=A0ABQ6FUQ2_9CHLR|nr:hypothetical protein KDH_48430 [Dictyobacter sp. S3.2.2.5]